MNHRRRTSLLTLAAAWCLFTGPLSVARADSPPTTQPAAKPTTDAKSQEAKTSAITGQITVEQGKPLPEMIVFLEPTDPKQAFTVPPEPIHVSQRDAKFTPSLVIVCVGQSVDFSNDESRPLEHNVFSRSPAKAFDLGLYRPGTGPKLVKFDKPGPVRLFCSIHRYMDGIVYVCPTPFHARVAADGTFKIDSVPAGRWKLRTWQRNQRYNERESLATVEAGKPAVQNLELSRK